MTPAISQGIVAAQAALLAFTVILSFAGRGRALATAFAWISSLMALGTLALFSAAVVPSLSGVTGAMREYAQWAGVAVAVAILEWVAVKVIETYRHVAHERHLQKPKTINRAAEELREILRSEGLELDSRLQQAEQEREQFLYALEERHAKQIAGLAQEYQHEAHTILHQLLDQLAAETLLPQVEQRLAEHQQQIESELGALDAVAGGETLTTLRSELAELLERVESAEARVAAARELNPDQTMEDKVAARLDAIDETIAARVETVTAQFDVALTETTRQVDERIAQVGAMLDAKVDAASDPLARRMEETKAQVEERLQSYLDVLGNRFAETETILNDRIIEQETSLENRVVEMEHALEARLGEHATSIEQVLAQHDRELQGALEEQTSAIGSHFGTERERLIGELTEHAVALQERVAQELVSAEQRARETVTATQQAWNQFTGELEERFAVTREEALRAAAEIAAAERETLERDMAQITGKAHAEIAGKVEELGREAAWQRAQVERTVGETADVIKDIAAEALANSDQLFADLERVGAERVDDIRRQAEDALVQSRDYVAQLQDSLGAHLDQLRDRSGELANEMNERLEAVTSASHQAAQHIEAYSREVVDTTSRELAGVAEQQIGALSQRISVDLTNSVQANLDQQQRQYESHLSEIASRIVQQVQGDLAGLAEHARTAVTGELETMVVQARDHARREQEQGFLQIMNELARQQQELAEHARVAADSTRSSLDEHVRESRRQLEEAMASMGAHMREELVRFQDEGQRRVGSVIQQLRSKEQELLREEDRKLSSARSELMRQHQGALEQQVKSMVGGLSGALSSDNFSASSTSGISIAAPGAGFTAGIDRPHTPLVGGHDPAAAGMQPPVQGQPFRS